MKINLIILILILGFFSRSYAETYNFETKNLEILESGNLFIANDGIAKSKDNELKISADRFEYIKDKDQLKALKNGSALVNSKNLKINFDTAIFDQINLYITASGNVEINLINEELKIFTENITFDRKNNIIKSNIKTTIKDKFQNNFIVDSFIYEFDKNILKLVNLFATDKEKNNFKTSLAFIKTDTGRLIGKDVNINLNNKTFNKDNEPRLKGNSFISDNNITKINKAVFTTCKKNDDCPPWKISSKNIKHDKVKKTIYYDNATLSFYNKPILYFPKFFHPDPTVERQSGFLIPTVENSYNSKSYLNLPYFLAISENKDATFKPRLYPDDSFLIQSEYRQANLNSKHFIDLSLFTQKKNNENHIFYNYSKSQSSNELNTSTLNIDLQKTSNDTYLKNKKLESEIILDKDILKNSLNYEFYSLNRSINFETTIYENLSKNKNDKYEFIFPNINYYQKLKNKTSLEGDLSLNVSTLVKNYDTNVLEKKNTNDLRFESYPVITNNGLYNDYKLLIRNSITDSKNSINYKNKENLYLSSIFQYNSTLPLLKETDTYRNILKPRLSFLLAPKHTKDERNKNNRIDINDIYSLERFSKDSTLEGGGSITYGIEYSKTQKNNYQELFNFKIANNLRLNENNDLPKNNQLNQKTSNFFSEFILNPNDYIKTKYISSIKNNFSDISYENLNLELNSNKLVTTFEYLNDNTSIDNSSFLSSSIKYKFDNFNNISFSTRENKSRNITEYYKLMYQYINDCLTASIEYNKDFYNDRDLKPNESIFFKIAIMPFGQTSSPNFK